MEFEDDAFVLTARAHGETGAVVELLTARHGKYAAHVAGGAMELEQEVVDRRVQSGPRVSALDERPSLPAPSPAGNGKLCTGGWRRVRGHLKPAAC